MKTNVIIGPWPGSSVIPLRQYDDVRTEFARRVEQQAFDAAEAAMAGLPARFCEEAPRFDRIGEGES